MDDKRTPRWRQHLTEPEQARIIDIDEAIAMHRKLMRPLLAERRAMTKLACQRIWRGRDAA